MCQVEQEVEISVLDARLFVMLVVLQVLLQVLFGWSTTGEGWELCFLQNGKFVCLRCSLRDLDKQKLRLELSCVFTIADEPRDGIVIAM